MFHHSISNTRRARTRRGFSLIELLMTISIIGFLIGVSFPILGALKNSGRIETGVNTVSMASDVARQWVEQSKWAPDVAGGVPNARYSGTAAIFCPTGEIRITANTANAVNINNGFLEEISPVGHGHNGYSDIPSRDYVLTPPGSGMIGIARRANGTSLIAPPFAIVFDQNGHMTQGGMGQSRGLIYYDANYDGKYDIRANAGRSGSYIPEDWSREAAPLDSTNTRRILPFEGIDTVVGVIVYNKKAFKGAGFSLAGGGKISPDSNAGDWLRENGSILFFSPHTGVALRDEGKP